MLKIPGNKIQRSGSDLDLNQFSEIATNPHSKSLSPAVKFVFKYFKG